LRIGNNQLGCEPEDLLQFVDALGSLGLPEWLDGTIDTEDDEAWQIYTRETIDNIHNFLIQANTTALSIYFGFVMLVAFGMLVRRRSGFGAVALRGVSRIIFTHALALGLMCYILYTVRTSPWAVNISSGKTLMRPFPPVETTWRDDPAVSNGPTTESFRQDVLVGTRLDSRTIGAYSRWMDFHPGNSDLLDYISDFGGPLYRSYEKGLPATFHQTLVDAAIQIIMKKHGRFLEQDYRTGDWRLMSYEEAQEYVRLGLFTGRKSLLAALKEEIDFLVGDYRFVLLRGTTMSQISQSFLQSMEKKLFGTMSSSTASNATLAPKTTGFATPRPFLPQVPKRTEEGSVLLVPKSEYWTMLPEEELPEIALFGEVVYRTGRAYPATVVGISDYRYDIALYGETADSLGTVKWNVPHQFIAKRVPATEDAPARADYFEEGEWFSGRITRIRPNGNADILFIDGDFEEGVHRSNYALV
jgi:hypothetical protein